MGFTYKICPSKLYNHLSPYTLMQTYGDWNYQAQPFAMPTELAAAITKEMRRHSAHRQGT